MIPIRFHCSQLMSHKLHRYMLKLTWQRLPSIIHMKYIFSFLSYRQGLDRAFSLLKGRTRTGCQSLIIFVTDGRDTDGEAVRCGPGELEWSCYESMCNI